MALASEQRRYRGMLGLPDILGWLRGRSSDKPFDTLRNKPVYVAVDDLRGQLDAGRFLLDGNPPSHRIDASRLGVACRKGDGEVNNDFVLVQHGLMAGGVPHDLYGVFDGVTGYETEGVVKRYPLSHEVSRQAAEGIVRALGSSRANDAVGALAESLELANRDLCGSLLSGKGCTTATIVLLDPEKGTGFVGQVGDSRAYFAGKSGLDKLTIDQVHYDIQDRGKVRHLKPMLGDPKMVCDLREIELTQGGLLLLTTDGVHNVLEPETMRQTLLNPSLNGNLSLAAHDLSYKAQNLARIAGGRVDDASVVVARI